jgi:hypothetical protein
MKTAIFNNTKESVYLFHNEDDAVITDDGFMFDGVNINPQMNLQNASIVSCSISPDDWIGSRYIYDNDQWVLNELI